MVTFHALCPYVKGAGWIRIGRGQPHDNLMRSAVSFFLCLCWLLSGCQEDKSSSVAVDDYILKSGSLVISDREFSEELELKRAAYTYGIQKNPEEYSVLVVSLLDQLSEELVLRNAAKDKEVSVSELEIQAAEDEVRADYPEDSFEKMLIENAVSHEIWRRRLKYRLLFDRLIQKDLREKIEITPEEIVAYHNMNKNSSEPFKDEVDLVVNLRKEKAEAAYPEWIKTLEKTYPVSINRLRVNNYLKPMKTETKE